MLIKVRALPNVNLALACEIKVAVPFYRSFEWFRASVQRFINFFCSSKMYVKYFFYKDGIKVGSIVMVRIV